MASEPIDYGGKALGSLSGRKSHLESRTALVRFIDRELGWMPLVPSTISVEQFNKMTTIFKDDPTLPASDEL